MEVTITRRAGGRGGRWSLVLVVALVSLLKMN